MNTVVVHTTYNDMEAEMIRSLLSEFDIECQVASEISHALFPFTHDHRLAKIDVIVAEQEVDRAREIIADFLDSPEPLFTDDEFGDSDEQDQEES